MDSDKRKIAFDYTLYMDQNHYLVKEGRNLGYLEKSVDAELKKMLHIKGSGPEWYISSMLYSRDIPFWSGTLDIIA